MAGIEIHLGFLVFGILLLLDALIFLFAKRIRKSMLVLPIFIHLFLLITMFLHVSRTYAHSITACRREAEIIESACVYPEGFRGSSCLIIDQGFSAYKEHFKTFGSRSKWEDKHFLEEYEKMQSGCEEAVAWIKARCHFDSEGKVADFNIPDIGENYPGIAARCIIPTPLDFAWKIIHGSTVIEVFKPTGNPKRSPVQRKEALPPRGT